MALTHTHKRHHHKTHKNKNVLLTAILLLFSFALIEVIAGWWANSLTLMSDAAHMMADGISLILAAVAGWIATKPPSKKHSYGLGRAEVLGAWISSLLLVIIALFIAFEAVQRFTTHQPINAPTVIIIATIGTCINLVLAWILGHAEQTLNLRAATLHVLGDLLGSVAALISGLVIYFTHWVLIDAILSCFIAALILISSFGLLRETLLVLMEGVPLHLDLNEVGQRMAQINNVVAIHDLHIWTLSSGMTVLSAHVEIEELHHWKATLHKLQKLLSETFHITHITLQPEISDTRRI